MEPDPDEHCHPGEEDLRWSEDSKEQMQGKKPKAGYNKFSEHARGMISGEKQCALFCGGKRCKYCTPDIWPKEKMVINGLFSNWITENIVATSRPSDELIDKYKIIQQFKDKGIKSLINMQSPGEHADCGYGVLRSSGFSYTPQRFMDNNIYFYNFCWPDYGVGALSNILDMVQVMQFAMSQGKVAIHCHAGLGRTGVMIATYLVFTNRVTAKTAINYIRSRRPNSIQTRGQMECIQEFEAYLKPFRVVFASKAKDTHEFTLQHFLNRQKHILHGYEARKLKFVPKVIYITCERLLELAQLGNSLSRFIETGENEVHREELKEMQNDDESIIGLPRNESKSSLDELTNSCTKQSIVQRDKMVLSRKKSVSMEDIKDEKLKSFLSVPDDNQSDSSSRNFSPDEEEKQDTASKTSDQSSGDDVRQMKGKPTTHQKKLTPEEVAAELGATYYSPEVYIKAGKHESDLNEKDNAWLHLSKETDPAVVSLVLWEWLDQLKEPILRTQDLKSMLQFVNDPDTALQKLEKGARNTIMYLMKVIDKLNPVDDVKSKVYEKLLSYLTHQWVCVTDLEGSTEGWAMSTRDSRDEVESNERDHWGEMKPQLALKLSSFFINLEQFVKSSETKTTQK